MINYLKFTLTLFLGFSGIPLVAVTYYIDAGSGTDSNPGTSPGEPWATLEQASAADFQPGDRILLKRGDRFPGKLFLNGESGSADSPILIGAYGKGPRPVIDAAGYLAGIHLRNSSHIQVEEIEVTADGGVTVDGSDRAQRYGVLVDVTWNRSSDFITIRDLHIHGIFPEVGSEHEGATPTTYVGTAIRIAGTGNNSVNFPVTNVLVEGCLIERVGFKAVEMQRAHFIDIIDNQMNDIGGPALQPSRCEDIVVRGNTVDRSGSFSDPRMHGRGSGIWPWASDRVLIERNTFMHARGRADSCGVHIDFNCNDVVVQYNLSIDNAGGFIEVLGNNRNCTYRYNISINDGWRVKDELSNGPGTLPNNQDGHIMWISGFTGKNNPNNGPHSTYIYNNTIYVSRDIRSTFSIQEWANGLLIANNIFFVEGDTVDVTGNYADDYFISLVGRIVWKNNLYQRTGILPVFNMDLFTDTEPVIGDPLFANPGGLSPMDYIPSARNLVENTGIIIENLPDDSIGLEVGLQVDEDFFGNPVGELPDIGAIEFGTGTWGGYPVRVDGYCDTSSWMGWLWVAGDPWIWSYSMERWVYCPGETIGQEGAWIYTPN
jgi:hypothetical protein